VDILGELFFHVKPVSGNFDLSDPPQPLAEPDIGERGLCWRPGKTGV
jgi:hypothetical protein